MNSIFGTVLSEELATFAQGEVAVDTPAMTTYENMAMAKTAEEIVQEKMPHMRVVQATAGADTSTPKADAVSHDLAALRRKYFGNSGPGTADTDTAAQSAQPATDTGIVLVTPSTPSADAGKSQVKAVVVADGEIVSRQG